MNSSNNIHSTSKVTNPININRTRTLSMNSNNSDNSDLNYSVYVEKTSLSMSCSPDNKISSIFPKRNDKWVDSNLIHRCQQCMTGFSLLNRKHHCRACGRVVCHICSAQRIFMITSNKFERVCKECITNDGSKKDVRINVDDSKNVRF